MNLEAFLSGLAGSAVVVSVFGFVAKFWAEHYFGPYLKVKAQNAATKEDIQILLDQVRETQRVKAEIADRMWDRQAQWNSKKELHLQLLRGFATIAKVDAERISAPVKAGLSRVKAKGGRLGRPRVVVDGVKIPEMRQQGMSLRHIAKRCDTSVMTVQRLLTSPHV
jgi:hypothetical protein